MKALHVFSLVVGLTLSLAAASARAQAISWNLDRYGTIPLEGIAGVYAASYWNNSWPSNPTVDLMDSAGVATTLDISYSSYDSWSITGGGGPTPGIDEDGTYNRNLLNGYLSAGPAGWNPPTTVSSVTLIDVPYEMYDVIVYFSSDVAGREGEVTIDGTTYYFSTLGLASVSGSNALFAETTSTDSVYTAANYAIFRSLTGSTQTMTVAMRDNDEWGGIAGFQVVAVPEPSTMAALLGGLGVAAFAIVRRREKYPLSRVLR